MNQIWQVREMEADPSLTSVVRVVTGEVHGCQERVAGNRMPDKLSGSGSDMARCGTPV